MSLRTALGGLRAATQHHCLLGASRRHAQVDRYLTIQRFFERQASTSFVSRQTTQRQFQIEARVRQARWQKRWKSTESPPKGTDKGKEAECSSPGCPRNTPPYPTNPLSSPSSSSFPLPTSEPRITQFTPNSHFHHAQDYPAFIRRILHRLPAQSNPLHRPTKDDLLNAATSFWQRLRIRFKWFSIRGWRKFNTDDFTAFISWFLVGNTLWIIFGTTAFFSAVFATLNSLSLQSYVAKLLSDYLTRNTGFTVVFESAIVPRWGASTITFRNVYVSRRPLEELEEEEKDQHSEHQETTTQMLMASLGLHPRRRSKLDFPDDDHEQNQSEKDDLGIKKETREERMERLKIENNYTMFDINIEEVDVTLSLPRWLDGKGLVKDAKVRGVRGVIDRHAVFWDTSKPLIPADFRHETRTGDFELENLQIEDFLVTVYQPGGQRPFNVSLFNAVLGPFRKRWMFYDMMSAEGITGQYDNCLFSLHMPQRLGKPAALDADGRVKRLARFRIDGLPIEHAQYATGFEGPMSWITSGKVDAILDIKFPRHPDDEVDIGAIFNQIGRNVAEIAKEAGVELGGDSILSGADAKASAEAAHAAALASARDQADRTIIPGAHRLARPALRAPQSNDDDDLAIISPLKTEDVSERQVKIDIDLRFRDLKAAVPLYTTDLNLRNNALIRPIVAFINANRTLIPIHCKVTAPLNDFDGSWTLFETGLTSSISSQIQAALVYHVSSSTANQQRIKTVGAWGVQRGAEAVLNMVRTVVDPMHGQVQAQMASI